jgi:hypothetical protein
MIYRYGQNIFLKNLIGKTCRSCPKKEKANAYVSKPITGNIARKI